MYSGVIGQGLSDKVDSLVLKEMTQKISKKIELDKELLSMSSLID